jgi:hypothetical protein
MCQTLGAVHILIAGQAAEHGLTQQSRQQMSSVLATPTI